VSGERDLFVGWFRLLAVIVGGTRGKVGEELLSVSRKKGVVFEEVGAHKASIYSRTNNRHQSVIAAGTCCCGEVRRYLQMTDCVN
jgi:hypothetical protein